MTRRPVLGNLATLDGATDAAAALVAKQQAAPKGDTLRDVPPASLRPAPAQVRAPVADDDPALADLVASIRVHGVLEPVLAREVAGGLELLAGHRRVAAARLVGLPAVPVRVLPAVADADAAAITATENLARADLSAWEVSRALAVLRDAWRTAGRPVTVRALADAAGRSAGAVSEALRVADALPSAAVAGLDVQRLNALGWRDLVAATHAPDPVAAVAVLVAPPARGEATPRTTGAPHGTRTATPTAPRPRVWSLRLVRDDTGAPVATLAGGEVGDLAPADAAALVAALDPLVRQLRARARQGGG